MDPHDVRRLAQEFSTEANIAVEVDFPEGAEGVWPTPEAQLLADRSFYDFLGPECSDKPCQHVNCQRGAISQSVLCSVHHFESVRGRTCPFNITPKI